MKEQAKKTKVSLAVTLRKDKRLTATAYKVANALLFAATNMVGRAQAYRQFLATEAGVSLSSVDRATGLLEKLGYLTKIATYTGQILTEASRTFKVRGANIFLWAKEHFLNVKTTTNPRTPINKKAVQQWQEPMPPALIAVLARLGHAIADKHGYPKDVNAS